MNGPRSSLPEQRNEQSIWEAIESNDVARETLILTLAAGGTPKDVTTLLRRFPAWKTLREHSFKGRKRGMKSEEYVSGLRQKYGPEKELTAEQQYAIRQQILTAREQVRVTGLSMDIVTAFPDTRALYRGLLGQNATIYAIANTLRIYLRLPKTLNEASMKYVEDKAGGRHELMEELANGKPPFTGRLSDDILDGGWEEAKFWLDVAEIRHRERLEAFKDEQARAFMVALFERGATPYAVSAGLKEKFDIEVDPSILDEILRGLVPEGTMQEMREEFVRQKGMGIWPDIYEKWAEEAEGFLPEYRASVHANQVRSAAFARLAQRRPHANERRRSRPLQQILEAIGTRLRFIPDAEAVLSDVKLDYQSVRHNGRFIPAVTIEILKKGEELDKLVGYIRGELEDTREMRSATLRESLQAVGRMYGSAMVQVTLRVPGDEPETSVIDLSQEPKEV